MAYVAVNASSSGNALNTLLTTAEIVPGDAPSYAVAKCIYEFHPVGQKMAETPIKIAQSQAREIAIPGSPEDQVRDAFLKEWLRIGANRHIANTMKLARIYGIASIALLVDGEKTEEIVDFKSLYNKEIAINVFDPLNTAGSLVLNQNPNAMDFQKHTEISVGGKVYHRSRSVVIMNEEPIYIGYTSSAFGYVGRSVYQRAFYPLKSFILSMRTDDMVVRKAGVLIAKMKPAGSITDRLMQGIFGQKRQLLKEAETDNVLSIATDEEIETLNMQNLDGAYGMARSNILKNIATAADMPARWLDQETLAEGFGEGTEDAKAEARYVDNIREQMQPLYAFFDKIVQYRAWNPDFYKTIQKQFPDQYDGVDYETAFYEWVNAFTAEWPSLLIEPDSKRAESDKVKLEGLISAVEAMSPMLGSENKAKVILWLSDNLNTLRTLFPNPLTFEDIDELLSDMPIDTGEDEDKTPLSFKDAALQGQRTLPRVAA